MPSECADRLEAGEADVGIVPAIEAARLGLETVPGCAIACRGEVRSILLISKVPFERIETLAADSNSRTSAALARILLERRYGVSPAVTTRAPDLDAMLAGADAALMIGDAALRIDTAALPFRWLDLGVEWWELTGLPMVFAIWAARPGIASPELAAAFGDSLAFGLEHLDDIVRREAAGRGFDEGVVRDYLARNVVFTLGDEERRGLERFLALAGESGILKATGA